MDKISFVLAAIIVCCIPGVVQSLLCWQCRYSSASKYNGGFEDNLQECNDDKFDLMTVSSDHRDNYTIECDGTCSKVKIFYEDSRYEVVSRTCLDSCVEYNGNLQNVSIDYRCCNKHYCNRASRLDYSPAWLLAIVVILTCGYFHGRCFSL
ncbi:hypothetical protein CAPTEDRAFT_223956 [Capitella teleta]|uniref:UPAR/Ly6 domain-containing protein n=1 Tax=Capitella teleta TaxID=283909 RepID=R7VF38_CAPTE|nr:hypothetical protein CAPTEDRAFT_205930 [Capitella teleta]ELU14285.1 hypothetical protein CAPTEDRAFT_223956 [Capitella teleta]|eukprot:ELU02378.1 hypothetical protein CAPTEDRAFT_205930 [Capitella teleta]